MINYLTKIYTKRKSYEFFPYAYDKEKLTLGSSIVDDIWVPELSDFRYLITKIDTSLVIDRIDDEENIIESLGGVNPNKPYISLGKGEVHLICLYMNKKENTKYYNLVEIDNERRVKGRIGEITIGSKKDYANFPSRIQRVIKKLNKSHISINSNVPLVSSKHALIYFDDFAEFWIEDLGSTNGVYVNEFLVKSTEGKNPRKKLQYGDVIDLFSARLIFYESYIQVDTIIGDVNVSNLVETNPTVLSSYDSSPVLKLPPRKVEKLPDEEINLPTPPSEMKSNRDFSRILMYMMRPLIWLLLPVFAGVIDKSTDGGAGLNWTTSIMYTVGPLMMVFHFIMQIRKTKKENQHKFDRYLKKLKDKDELIDNLKKAQSELFSKTHTTPQDNLRRALSMDWRLWERLETDADFMEVRLGYGMGEPSFEITMPSEETLEEKPNDLVDNLERIHEAHQRINNYPITLDLKKNPAIGVVGIKEGIVQGVTALLVQLAVHHSSENLKICLITSEDWANEFDCLLYLPHMWADGHVGRLIFTGDARNKSCDGKCLDKNDGISKTCTYCYRNKMFDLICNSIEAREKLYNDKDAENKEFMPKYLFVISDMALLKGDNSHDIANYLVKDYSHLGIYTICIGTQRTDIPPTFETIMATGFSKANIDSKEEKCKRFHMDMYLKENIEKISRSLAPIRIESLSMDKSIPTNVSVFELFNTETKEGLQIIRKWEKHYTNPVPEAPVGKFDEKKKFLLNITRSGIGPHGVIGGTTGSGKSEFLLSVILGMAISCHPHRLSMVILDYKGGSTAEACKDLPHVRGIVTDLDKGVMTKRAIAAIKYEIEYRENIFRDFSNKTGLRIEDLESYNKTITDGPIIPYQMVIVDELAELKIREPAAMEILEDIARRGRSTGIYLLLTTQNPQGVINAQIAANVNYKICFRISKDNSRGIIESPDAAYISDKTPGRGIMRVGNNELVTFQSAYTGMQYSKRIKQKDPIPSIYAVDREGQKHPIYISKEEFEQNRNNSHLDVILDEIEKTANENSIKGLEDLWKPILPHKLSLKDVYEIIGCGYNPGKYEVNSSCDLKLPVGLLDDIKGRIHTPLNINFLQERSHMAIYGPAFSGKTTFMYTIIISLVIKNHPENINMYIFDYSSSTCTYFEDLPHVGDVFDGNNSEEVTEGQKILKNEVTRRAQLFNESRAGNIDDYNKMNPTNTIPYIFVFIDKADSIVETKSKSVGIFADIIANGVSHGIFFVITAHDKRTLPYEFRRYLENIECCLWPSDISNYELPKSFNMTARVPGRGIVNGLECQIAAPVTTEAEVPMNIKLINMIKEINDKSGAIKPINKPISTKKFSLSEMASAASEATVNSVPIGRDENFDIYYINIKKTRQILISFKEKRIGTQLVEYFYKLLSKYSQAFRESDKYVFTRDKSFNESFKNEKCKIILNGYDDPQIIQQEFINIYKTLKNGEVKISIICDEFDELIKSTNKDTYQIIRYMFKDEDIIENAFVLTGAEKSGISAWKKKGCPPFIRAINENISIIADGNISEHEWILRSENKIIQNNYIYIYNGHEKKYIQLALEDRE